MERIAQDLLMGRRNHAWIHGHFSIVNAPPEVMRSNLFPHHSNKTRHLKELLSSTSYYIN